MNPNTLRALIILALCMAAAVLFGTVLATGSYEFLILLAYALFAVYLVAAPGLIPLLGMGLLSPFTLPIPFVHSFPFILLILGVCWVKLFFWRAVGARDLGQYRHCFSLLFIVFFVWVGLHYAINPVLPNVRGFGTNISGFRAYMDYGICFMILVTMPFIVSRCQDGVQLVRWLGWLSLFFIVFLVPFMFTKSVLVAQWLMRFGLAPMQYDNGWLRFVVLPAFGLVLFCLALLPNVGFGRRRRHRLLLMLISVGAIILGGSRIAIVTAPVMLIIILFLRRRVMAATLVVLSGAATLVAFYYIGERLDVNRPLGVMRVLAISSERVARATEAADSYEWRKIRWERAMEHIRRNPYFGSGYGGLQNAWVFADVATFSEAMVEVSVASGSIHNGYLASACALGVPGTILFILAFGIQLLRNARQAFRLEKTHPQLSGIHILICAQLVGLSMAVVIGADLNSYMMWFYLGFGEILRRRHEQELSAPAVAPVTETPSLAEGARVLGLGRAWAARS